jgi:hypothetical protein
MVADLWLYQLMLVGLLWLVVMLYSAWARRCGGGAVRPAKPRKSSPKRLRDPKPFAGLTHKPPCTACETKAQTEVPAVGPPPVLVSTRGRPCRVDTSAHFCPDPNCDYHGWVGRGNIRANGHPSSGPWRQLRCTVCGGYVLETHSTPLHGKQVPVDLLG